MVLPASLAPAFPPRNCPFLVQSIFLASHKLPPHFRMSDIRLTMLRLHSIGAQIASRRKALGFSQSALADKAGVSRATLEALENGRSGELGFSKVANILSALGLELKLHEANLQRPTLDELLEEDRDDEGLDRRR